MEEDSFNQTFFNLETTLSRDEYAMTEKQFQKEKTKAFTIIFKNEIIGSLHSFILEEEEYTSMFSLFKNNQLILADKLNPTLVNVLIHYFYFREVKNLSIKLIFDFLDVTIFLHAHELIKKIINFIKNNLTDAKKVTFIRKHIFSFLFVEISNKEINIAKVFEECEIFLLQNNYVEEYLSFYAQNYFSKENNLDLENELLKKLELMNNYKIEGLHIIRLLILFKDHLIEVKNKSEKNFSFNEYAEKIVDKYAKLKEIAPQALNEILPKLELNSKDFKIKFLNEKIASIENEMILLKENSNRQIIEAKRELELLKKDYKIFKIESEQKLTDQKTDAAQQMTVLHNKFTREIESLKEELPHIKREFLSMFELFQKKYEEDIQNERNRYCFSSLFVDSKKKDAKRD